MNILSFCSDNSQCHNLNQHSTFCFVGDLLASVGIIKAHQLCYTDRIKLREAIHSKSNYWKKRRNPEARRRDQHKSEFTHYLVTNEIVLKYIYWYTHIHIYKKSYIFYSTYMCNEKNGKESWDKEASNHVWVRIKKQNVLIGKSLTLDHILQLSVSQNPGNRPQYELQCWLPELHEH